ncbi:MAG TPA: hypothetical protein VIT42_02200 [Microlunatus sp.]
MVVPAEERPSRAPVRPSGSPDFVAADFPGDPALHCDIVMKGGITSGVVYPLAVCELATTYRLRSVGGASAGAIAAAAAVAAEMGRRSVLPHPRPPTTGPGTTTPGEPIVATAPSPVPAEPGALPRGFLGLAQFPKLLAESQPDGRSLLFHLFRPQPGAERLFGLLSAVLEQKTELPDKPSRVQQLRAVLAVVAHATAKAPIRSLLGVLLGLTLLVVAILGLVRLPSGSSTVLAVALALAIAVGALATTVGLVIALLSGVLADLGRLPSMGFGMSSGRGTDDSQLALTPWLYRRLQDLAGRSYDRPLTFGDLQADELKLQMMTTNLSRAQPMAMPWNDDIYFFEPAEFEKLFGEVVVRAMIDHPPPLPSGRVGRRIREVLLVHAGTKRPFPRAADLPLIVATRMSLSFPLLIAAVPLYALDYTGANLEYVKAVREWRQQHPDADLAEHAAGVTERPVFDVNWFSDGGLTANLPVQFFDSVLPSRPTFAIDLAPFSDDHPRSPDERDNSYLPLVNQGGGHRRTARWAPKPLSALFSFGLSLVETARTWVDQASLTMPGYRDRVVTVYQDGAEGGINLAMPPELVTALSQRGRFAAARLVDRFGPGGGGWPNHRWVRYRTSTAALSDWLAAFERGYTVQPPFYDALLDDPDEQPSYRVSGEKLAAVRKRTEGLRTEIADWATDPDDAFTANRPQQPPILRLVPPTDGVP